MLTVFIECRCSDTLHFSSGQSRFQNIGCVNGSFGSPRSDQGMEFVDEDDHVARQPDFFHDFFHSLFKFTAIFCPCYHRRKIECYNPFIDKDLRHLVVNNPLGQTLGDGRFSDPGFSNQYRVILRPAAQHLNDSFNLISPADDGVKLPFSGHNRQVPSELV